MSDANRASMGYVEESTWGTTPTAALQTLRITGETLQDNEESVESNEILSDRNLRDVIRSGQYSSGAINFEHTDEVLDDLLEGALCAAWSSNTLINGITKKSYSVEKMFPVDGSPATHYLSATGCRVDTLDLNFAQGQVITGSIGLIGKKMAAATSSIGTSYTDAATTDPNSAVNVTTLTEAAASPGDVTEFTISIANNLRRQMAISETDPIGIGYGGFRVTGRLTMYFENTDLYAKYQAETKTEVIVTITDSASSTKTYTIPKVRWGTPQILIPGTNQDILAAFPWTAVYDTGISGVIQIDRA